MVSDFYLSMVQMGILIFLGMKRINIRPWFFHSFLSSPSIFNFFFLFYPSLHPLPFLQLSYTPSSSPFHPFQTPFHFLIFHCLFYEFSHLHSFFFGSLCYYFFTCWWFLKNSFIICKDTQWKLISIVKFFI